MNVKRVDEPETYKTRQGTEIQQTKSSVDQRGESRNVWLSQKPERKQDEVVGRTRDKGDGGEESWGLGYMWRGGTIRDRG